MPGEHVTSEGKYVTIEPSTMAGLFDPLAIRDLTRFHEAPARQAIDGVDEGPVTDDSPMGHRRKSEFRSPKLE